MWFRAKRVWIWKSAQIRSNTQEKTKGEAKNQRLSEGVAKEAVVNSRGQGKEGMSQEGSVGRGKENTTRVTRRDRKAGRGKMVKKKINKEDIKRQIVHLGAAKRETQKYVQQGVIEH